MAEDSIGRADAWVDLLDDKLRLLATQPLMGRIREELASGLRSLSFGRYVVFYQPLDDGIDVVRVLHSARDIDSQFSDDNTSRP
jgi:toxin ParE1/3/4